MPWIPKWTQAKNSKFMDGPMLTHLRILLIQASDLEGALALIVLAYSLTIPSHVVLLPNIPNTPPIHMPTPKGFFPGSQTPVRPQHRVVRKMSVLNEAFLSVL